MRQLLQTIALRLYRAITAARLLDRPWVRDGYERGYFLYKQHFEAKGVTALRAWVRPGTSVIDVGAHIGFFTLHLARWVSAGGRVLAIEPDPLNLERLRRTLARAGVDSRVDTIQAAVAEASGQGFLELNPQNPADHHLGTGGIRVALTTIDELLRERDWPVVSLIKIDVQGAEPRVLAGAAETIARFRPALFVEVHDQSLRRYGSSSRSLLDACSSLGYTPRVLSPRAVSSALTVEEILDLESRRGYVDVLWLPSENVRAE